MSSVEYFREFVNERLTAAVEEIFGVFKNIIFEYEEKIHRQRSLLDVRQHEINGMELPQRHVWKEEDAISDQQFCNQEKSSTVDQEDPQSPQMKVEQDELNISQKGEQVVVKQETDAFLLTPTYEESDHSEDQTLCLNSDESLSAAYKDSVVNMPVISSVVLEPNSNQQLLSGNSDVAGSRNQRGDKPKKDFKIKPKYDFKMNGGERAYVCKICGKVFRHYSHLEAHIRIHTGEKPYVCKICGKNFRQIGQLRQHVSVHTGEKPYLCKTCGKDFRLKSHLKVHMRTHTREKPLLCKS